MSRVKDEDVKHLAVSVVAFVNKHGLNNLHRAYVHNGWPNVPYRGTSIDLLTVKHLDHREFIQENRIAVQMITELSGLIKMALDAGTKMATNDDIFDFCEKTMENKDLEQVSEEMKHQLMAMRELAWQESQVASKCLKDMNRRAGEYISLLQFWIMGGDPLMAKLAKVE